MLMFQVLTVGHLVSWQCVLAVVTMSRGSAELAMSLLRKLHRSCLNGPLHVLTHSLDRALIRHIDQGDRGKYSGRRPLSTWYVAGALQRTPILK